MHGLRKLMLGSAAAALAVTALGAPAAAADDTGTLAIVQGRPGVKVDICIGNKEQKSGAGYGSVLRKDVVGTGPKLIRFFKKNDARNCGGTKIGSKSVDIAAGDDLTIVLTAKAPKVVMFDNTSPSDLGEIPPRGGPLGYSWVSWASAADFDTNFFYDFWNLEGTDIPVSPAANPVFEKGSRFTGTPTDSVVFRLWATLPENPGVVAGKRFFTKDERRYEAILVGTRKANAKFVFINRGISAPSP